MDVILQMSFSNSFFCVKNAEVGFQISLKFVLNSRNKSKAALVQVIVCTDRLNKEMLFATFIFWSF